MSLGEDLDTSGLLRSNYDSGKPRSGLAVVIMLILITVPHMGVAGVIAARRGIRYATSRT